MSDTPADPPFELTVAADDGLCAIAVRGELDMASVTELDEAVERTVSAGVRRLVVDLSSVTFMDSSGLSGLLRVRQRAERFAIVPSPAVRRVVELVGLVDELRLAATPDEGRAAVQGG